MCKTGTLSDQIATTRLLLLTTRLLFDLVPTDTFASLCDGVCATFHLCVLLRTVVTGLAGYATVDFECFPLDDTNHDCSRPDVVCALLGHSHTIPHVNWLDNVVGDASSML